MTDRELLELAAKSVGLKLVDWNDNWFDFGPGYRYERTDGYRECWNPLSNGEDALVLATTLDLTVCTNGQGPYVADRFGRILASHPGTDRKEKYEVVRRQIVRAAAAIGKKMP
jgi:hypothetical protein